MRRYRPYGVIASGVYCERLRVIASVYGCCLVFASVYG